ncbi:MAG: hypothetical protein ABFD54_16235 [Armatimonadota bacterium]|nr:hypothetical protein [bacterium]
MITVKIEYMPVGDTDWKIIDISPEIYFIEDEKPFNVESIPQYDHAIDYLCDSSKLNIRITRIRIQDDIGNSIEITETFWDKQRNRVIERVDSGCSPYQEIILDLRVPDHHEIMRLVREDGYLTPVYHGIIVDNPDGSNTERKIEL